MRDKQARIAVVVLMMVQLGTLVAQREMFRPAPAGGVLPRAAATRSAGKPSAAAKAFDQWKSGAPRLAPKRGSKATITERVEALEALAADHQYKLQFIGITDHVDPNFGHIYGWFFNGVRRGGNTTFWMYQNAGQGASESIGDDFDRFGLYIEKEGTQRYTGAGADGPFYVANLATGSRPNYGAIIGAGGSSSNNFGVLSYPNLVMDAGDGSGRSVIRRVEGDQLVGIPTWFVGHDANDAVRLFPR